MRGYMLQGSYGKFGLTSAMLRRCNEFTQRGIKCVTTTVDFTEDIYNIESTLRLEKEIDSRVEFRNPYIDLSNKAEAWHNQISPKMQGAYLLCHYNEHNNSSEINYFKITGNAFDGGENVAYDRIKKTYNDNIIIYEEYLLKEKRTCEKYYAKTGQCICIKKWNDKNEQQEYLLTFDYSTGFVTKHKNNFSWCVSWLDNLISSDIKKDISTKPFIICDGPGSANKISKLDKNKVTRIYVLHNNHMHANGKLTKRDAWNLSSPNNFDVIVSLTPQHNTDLESQFKNYNFKTIPNFSTIKKPESITTYSSKRIGFFGQLIDRKGVKDAIETIQILRYKYGIDVYLDIYGISPTNTNDAINSYKSYAKEREIESHIHFKGYSKNVVSEMANCLCMLFPSYSEAQPLSIIEALSVGTPVIAYDCKYGPSSMISNSFNGFLSQVGDVYDLAKNIEMIITAPELRKELSQNAIRSAYEISDKNRIYNLWLNVINK